MKVQASVKRNPAIFMMLLFVFLALPLPLFAETPAGLAELEKR